MSACFRETNLQRITADLASLFRSAIEKGGVNYVVLSEGREESVWVDRDMWEKIVFNIIGNAFKFTLSGQITVSCHLAGGYMQFSVKDTGIGIPSHDVPRIFENFHRAHSQNGRSFEGTGMGLALTQELVKLHGGKLEVESIFGQGTTFSVFIPVGKSHLPKDQLEINEEDNNRGQYGLSIIEEAERWTSDKTDPASDVHTTSSSDSVAERVWIPPSNRGCIILIVDDNADMRRFVKGVLSPFYQVLEASNGQIALEVAAEKPPDLILSDVMMPGLDGFGLLKVLRSLQATRSIPFILLSAKGGETARVDGLVAGADDYLPKPFSPKELIARVYTLLDNARMRIELEKRVTEISRELMESEERFRLVPS